MLLYSVHRITYQHALSPSILEKNKNKLCHRKSQCIIGPIGGWGKMVWDRLAPTLGGRLASHAHYLRGRFFKYVMSLNVNNRRY